MSRFASLFSEETAGFDRGIIGAGEVLEGSPCPGRNLRRPQRLVVYSQLRTHAAYQEVESLQSATDPYSGNPKTLRSLLRTPA